MGADGKSSYLKDIDWSRTRAYTFGLAGVYINQKGREAEGIVDPGEAGALKRELAAKLSGLYDEQRARPAVRHAWPSDSLYTGPYLDAAPDVIVGCAEGYRASWDAAVGKVTAHVFADNEKAWSGDHCVDPHLVPGVLFSNRKIEAADPGIEDMAPTALDLFGIDRSALYGGQVRVPAASASAPPGGRGMRVRLAVLTAACYCLTPRCANHATRAAGKRMIVLGVDGMDPVFVEAHFASLPNLHRLRQQGAFRRLATTIPPQSPVAWSSVITGMDPGGHGIFDFVHRNPSTRMPVSSMAETTEPTRSLAIGPYLIPMSGGGVRSLRAGRTFWQMLEEHGVSAKVIRMPANFPPAECEAESLAGMGTPDMTGSFGTFSFYTDDPSEKRDKVPGGQIVRVALRDGARGTRHRRTAQPDAPRPPGDIGPADRSRRSFGTDCALRYAGHAVHSSRRRMVGMGARGVFHDPARQQRSWHFPCVPAAGASLPAGVRQPGEHRPRGSGAAHLHARAITAASSPQRWARFTHRASRRRPPHSAPVSSPRPSS